MTIKNRANLLVAITVITVGLAGCGGGGGGGSDDASDLFLIDVSVGRDSGVALNEIIKFEFSEDLDPDSVRADTIRIRQGPNFGIQVPGEFRTDGNLVEFFPRLPVKGDLSDSGMHAGTEYEIMLPGANSAVSTVRSVAGDRLIGDERSSFSTAIIGGRIFIDNFLDAGPPEVRSVNPIDGATEVPTDNAIELTFNRRPLLAGTVNSGNIYMTLVERDGIVLNRPVEGQPVLLQSHESVRVVWEPRFPLADRATYRLTVERRTQDLIGSDVTPFTSTFETRDEPARPGEIVLNFDVAEFGLIADVDVTTASWSDSKPGELSALFTAAGGDGTAGDLTPTADQTITADDLQRGVSVQVIDGAEVDVFNFRTLDIPEGVTVRFDSRPAGPNRPIMLVALKDIRIDGTINVAGGRGADAETASTTSNIPLNAGGKGGPGSGDGAANYTGSLATNAPAISGADGAFGGGRGGEGGTSSGHANYSYSGGGGGGGSREDGADGTRGGYITTSWNGKGGAGGMGFPSNLERRPNTGAGGGGAGGLGYYWPTSTNWRQGAGGGGGGGGTVTIQSAGKVTIGSKGRILAAGGDGGNLSAANSSYYAGGGGGGGGGSILIRATVSAALEPGATIDVAGGIGGRFQNTFTRYLGGEGGKGGAGFIRLEASEDESLPGSPLITGVSQSVLTSVPSQGVFSPKGGGAPSVGQTLWLNLGVFDPEMVKPASGDTVANLFNDSMKIEVQVALENLNDLGKPELSALDSTDADKDGAFDDTLDPSRVSEWTRIGDIEGLNGRGFQFIRIRVTFQLDDSQGPLDPLPSLDRLRLPYRF